MELARTECVGSTGTLQSRQNAVVARREFEGFEDVVLEDVDQGTQSRETNERQQTRELELWIFLLPATCEIVDPVQGSPPIARPGSTRGSASWIRILVWIAFAQEKLPKARKRQGTMRISAPTVCRSKSKKLNFVSGLRVPQTIPISILSEIEWVRAIRLVRA